MQERTCVTGKPEGEQLLSLWLPCHFFRIYQLTNKFFMTILYLYKQYSIYSGASEGKKDGKRPADTEVRAE